jgi:DNA replication ATP-dependent helicase Dna2
MDKKEHIEEIISGIEKIVRHEGWNAYQKNKAWFEIFNMILELASAEEQLHFTTLFSRLAYVGTKYRINSQTMHLSHLYRKGHQQGLIRNDTETKYAALGLYVCVVLLRDIFNTRMDDTLFELEDEASRFFNQEKSKIKSFKPIVEAVVFEINQENRIVHFYEESEPSIPRIAHFDIHDKNEIFTPNIDSLAKTFDLPIEVNFIDTDITEEGVYYPSALVIQPDRLLDVTSISTCFNDYGAEPFLYLINKFKTVEASTPILVGNLVNYILDELVNDPNISFKDIIPKLFRYNPLGFAFMDDQQVKDVLSSLQDQYLQLWQTIHKDFREKAIDKKGIFLEPSFYSRDYGIQGRLDVLHEQKGSEQSFDIIELKSGKTFKPNVYGINASHYIQTLLYDLIIKSAFNPRTKSFNYILYSKEKTQSLRYAPPVRTQQYEAMKLRNDLIALEYKLTTTHIDNAILKYIKPENFEKLKGFSKEDIIIFHNLYYSLTDFYRAYFDYFTAFIAMEHFLAKIGESGMEKQNGHAALWLENREAKAERFAILDELTIIDNQSSGDNAMITFKRSKAEDRLVNFRIGDIAVLYIYNGDPYRAVLKNQIFKCSIIALSPESVTVKLRNKQYNQSLFNQDHQWALEQDTLDSGFNGMYKNMYSWAEAPPSFKNLYLGIQKPSEPEQKPNIVFDDSLTYNQNTILNKMIAAKDYYILWGPPGTGKTSAILKNLTKYLHENTSENILLLAYTNRAVDEICEAIKSIHPDYKHKFIRLGSHNATSPRYQSNLIDEKMSGINTRREILQMIHETKIYVSTVSSIFSKPELMKVKKFETVIIDEASQILEPMLCGLLSHFKRFILIGDHKQLPAVVVQDSKRSTINHPLLHEKGFINTRTSFFERLYHQCVRNGWTHAYSILDGQGRMHETLMSFPNQYFYENQLKTLDKLPRQRAPYFFNKIDEKTPWIQQRMVFISTPMDDSINWKTNIYEADKCIETLQHIIAQYKLNNMELHDQSIGIITPYRAQIALIQKRLEQVMPEMMSIITVDTVERYQGGSRDIIIVSFCVNRLSQLDNLISLSQEGVDRKLNVTLTRAKEQIILIGHEEMLSKNEVYRKLIHTYHKISDSTQ